MSRLFSGDYQNCPRVGHSVCVRQTELECRAPNDCASDRCPVQSEFTQAPSAAQTPEFGARIGLGWLAGRING